jgi:hypothetical protein
MAQKYRFSQGVEVFGAALLPFYSAGEKTALFEPFIYKMHYFTKTGSGRT